jgi:ubiquinone/menaquinone biosynthesis C-methylase UbiE
MPITLAQIQSRIPNDHTRQITAEYYIEALPVAPIRVLDVGAGDGRSIDVFRRRLPDLKWVGVDIPDSPEVRERRRADCEFVSYDGVNLPFDPGSFDVVYSRQVFEHVRHPEPLLREITRVLRPGGLFIGSVSQLEPLHSFSLWNFTYYGFAVICEDAGLRLEEFRPGLDGFTLCFRNFIVFWLRQNIAGFFLPMINNSSPFNSYIESLGGSEKKSAKQINLDKLTYCGHLCFKFSKPAR